MKILAVADLHGSQYRLNILLENIKKYLPELVIICGDITQFGPGEVATNFLNQIPIETFAITGNIDTPDVDNAINKSKAKNIDGEKIEKNGIKFIGMGGTHPSQQKISSIEKLVDEKSVIVSHVPPHGLQDKVYIGKHAGSKELREFMNKRKPRLIICGHIHEDSGYTKAEETIVVNCSMGKRGEGAIIEINDKITVKMI